MARNSEKAQTLLARWRAANVEGLRDKEVRPHLASMCDDLKKAEIHRRDIIREISGKVMQIQNAGLGRFRLMEMNDEINKLTRVKGHWEDRIRELGGHDFRKFGQKLFDHEGRVVPGSRGYRYYGATKDLPGVKELFEVLPLPPKQKSGAQLMKSLDANFYGYRLEDDDDILLDEQEMENKVRDVLIEKRATDLSTRAIGSTCTTSDSVMTVSNYETRNEGPPCLVHSGVPTQKEIEQALIERKKRELFDKYVSQELLSSENETKKLLGIE